ncbi:MAG TPA: hypothetical protein PK095_01415, partial [Myxococcota bacterium]|nr:hypothetical protein [Myxococcota bacterium]
MSLHWLALLGVLLAACEESGTTPPDTQTAGVDTRDARDVPEVEVRDTDEPLDGVDGADVADTSEPSDVDTMGSDTEPGPDTSDTTDTGDTRDTTDTNDTNDAVEPVDTWTFSPPQTGCGETTIRFDPPGEPSQVLVTGSFSEWSANPPGAVAMTRSGSVFAATLTLPAGDHQLKFIVDGTW